MLNINVKSVLERLKSVYPRLEFRGVLCRKCAREATAQLKDRDSNVDTSEGNTVKKKARIERAPLTVFDYGRHLFVYVMGKWLSLREQHFVQWNSKFANRGNADQLAQYRAAQSFMFCHRWLATQVDRLGTAGFVPVDAGDIAVVVNAVTQELPLEGAAAAYLLRLAKLSGHAQEKIAGNTGLVNAKIQELNQINDEGLEIDLGKGF
jgi:hypothetical protein